MKNLKLLLKTLLKALKKFKVEAYIAIIGIIMFILWIFGTEEGFLGIFLTMLAIYTAYRLNSVVK